MKRYKVYGDIEYMDEVLLLDITEELNNPIQSYMLIVTKIKQHEINKLINKDAEKNIPSSFLSSFLEVIYTNFFI